MKIILSIDPGRDKCGLAVVTDTGILHQSIIPRDQTSCIVSDLINQYSPDIIITGNGTGSQSMCRELGSLTDIPIEIVDEAYSSMKARIRFFKCNPPKGLRRLLPMSLLTPDHPYDDYVAVLLAEAYMKDSS
ncbi:MAG: pre-16S rRNA-processing nuclease YqgF [Armatimonadota bacterium]